jgi:hypothetical protein
LKEILQRSNLKELEEITDTLTEEVIQLSTAKKALLSENYSKFISVDKKLSLVCILLIIIIIMYYI